MAIIRTRQLVLASMFATGLCASGAQAANVIHYWNFDNINDSVGGLVGSDYAAATVANNYTLGTNYGEAYAGAGNALQTKLSGYGFKAAITSELNFSSDFAISYWQYSDTSDNDVKGMRALDTLGGGLTSGIQIGTEATNKMNARFDDTLTNQLISNTVGSTPVLVNDNWSLVVINFTFGGNLDIYFDGVLVDSDDASGLTGAINASQSDLEIGQINGGGTVSTTQAGALDDLAFYNGTLSQSDIQGLLAGGSPTAIPEPGSMALLALGGLATLRRRRRA